MAQLTGISGPAAGIDFTFDANATLGRGDDNDVTIPDPALSRRHLEIRIAHGRMALRDCESANGTFYHGQPVSMTWLKDVDQFEAGESTFCVRLNPAGKPAAVAPPTPPPRSADGHARTRRPAVTVTIASIGAIAMVSAAVLVAMRHGSQRTANPNAGQPPRPAAPAGAQPAPPVHLDPLADSVTRRVTAAETPALRTELSAWLRAQHSRDGMQARAALAVLVDDPDYVINLARHELLRVCDGAELAALTASTEGREFLTLLLNDVDWMQNLLCSGPAPAPGRALWYLFVIWKHDRDCLSEPYKTLATAMALEKSEGDYRGEPDNYRLFRRFQLYKDAHRGLRLHAAFDTLKTWEMRFAVELGHSDANFRFLLDGRNQPIADYGGACWACAYIPFNIFGDTIQGPLYYRPWTYRYSWAENARKTGGVCGTLSTFGAATAKVHGVPAMTAGQPGHCAYCIRHEDGVWRTHYNVTWPTSPHNSFWAGNFTYLALTEDVYADTETVRRARRHVWQAELLKPSCRFEPPFTYRVYRGRWSKLPDFASLHPTDTGTTDSLDYGRVVTNRDAFAIVYEGSLTAEESGRYRLATASDDGSRLYVDDVLVVDNDGSHGNQRRDGLVTLAAGTRHPFRLEYFDVGGADNLDVDAAVAGGVPGVSEAYALAVDACPRHYGIWLEYGDWLAAGEATTPQTWDRYARLLAHSLHEHQEAAWNALDRQLERITGAMNEQEKLTYLVHCHERLREEGVADFTDYPFDRVLNRQLRLFAKDTEAQLEFFQRVLMAHAGSRHYFPRVLSWGNERFAKNPKLSTAFVRALTTALQGKSDAIAADQIRRPLAESILQASQSEATESFQKLSDVADSMLDLAAPGERHLNADQVAKYPEITPFPGALLSAKGVLKTSTTSRWDTPLLYRAVLRPDPGGGFFHTDPEQKPWAIVKLEGEGELTGIVLVNRWETARERQVPLHVSISADGKTWQEVFATDKVENVWRIDLGGRGLRAAYVRAEVDHNDTPDNFHLRNFLVYGKKLF